MISAKWASLFVVSIGLLGSGFVGDSPADESEKVQAAPKSLFPALESPPEVIPPPDPKVRFYNIIYQFQKSTCNLASGEFDIFLPDVPKAILFRSVATKIVRDDKWYYCYDDRFKLEWAFARHPENNFFLPHAVWYRPLGEKKWQLKTSEGTMAEPG